MSQQKSVTHYLVIEYNADLNTSSVLESWANNDDAVKSAANYIERLKNIEATIPLDVWDEITDNISSNDVDTLFDAAQKSKYSSITKENIENMMLYDEYYMIKDYIYYTVEPVKHYE